MGLEPGFRIPQALATRSLRKDPWLRSPGCEIACPATTAGTKMSVSDQAQYLKHHRRSNQCSVACLVVRRRNLYHVTTDQVQTPQTTQQALGFQCGNAADLGGAGTWCVDGIEPVYVK